MEVCFPNISKHTFLDKFPSTSETTPKETVHILFSNDCNSEERLGSAISTVLRSARNITGEDCPQGTVLLLS